MSNEPINSIVEFYIKTDDGYITYIEKHHYEALERQLDGNRMLYLEIAKEKELLEQRLAIAIEGLRLIQNGDFQDSNDFCDCPKKAKETLALIIADRGDS